MAKTELPFEYHIFQMPSKSLQFNMSDSLRKEFDAFTNDLIKMIKSEKSIDSMVITFQMNYQILSNKLREEMKEKALDKRATHSFEELRYMFKWGYMLKEAYPDMNLKLLGDLFGIKNTAFSKLGMYPLRAYDYQRGIHQSRGYFKNTDAHAICEVINNKIQIPYLPNAQIVVSNDTDMYVDLVQGDSKMFIVTHPTLDNMDILPEIIYDHARFCFVSVNIKDGVAKLKDRIISILDMNDKTLSRHFIIDVLRNKSVMLNDCVRDRNVDAFLEMRKEYQDSIERLNILKSELDSDYIDPEVNTDEDKIQDEIEILQNNISRWEKELSNNVAGDRYLKKYKTSNDLRAYLNSVRDYTLQYHLEIPIDKLISEKTVIDLAAVYFVIQTFGGVEANYDVSYEDFQKVKEDLKTRRLADYLDRICKDSRTPHIQNIYSRGQLIPQLEQMSNQKNSYLKKKPVQKDKSTEPVLIYIDTDAYDITQEEIDEIMRIYQVALVIRTTKVFAGVQILDENLHLSANMEGLQNEYKY